VIQKTHLSDKLQRMALFHFKQSLPVNNTGFETDYKTEKFGSSCDTDKNFEPVCHLERKFESVWYQDRNLDSVCHPYKKFEPAFDPDRKFKPERKFESVCHSERNFQSNWHTDRKFDLESNFRSNHDKDFTHSSARRGDYNRKEQDWSEWREGYRKEETGHRDRRILLQGVDLGLVLTQTIHKETIKIQQENRHNIFHMSGS